MRVERENRGVTAGRRGQTPQSRQHRLMTTVHTVEIADRDVTVSPGGRFCKPTYQSHRWFFNCVVRPGPKRALFCQWNRE